MLTQCSPLYEHILVPGLLAFANSFVFLDRASASMFAFDRVARVGFTIGTAPAFGAGAKAYITNISQYQTDISQYQTDISQYTEISQSDGPASSHPCQIRR